VAARAAPGTADTPAALSVAVGRVEDGAYAGGFAAGGDDTAGEFQDPPLTAWTALWTAAAPAGRLAAGGVVVDAGGFAASGDDAAGEFHDTPLTARTALRTAAAPAGPLATGGVDTDAGGFAAGGDDATGEFPSPALTASRDDRR